jgi:hypothetical protein
MVLFVCLFFSFDHGIVCLRKEKKRQTNNTMVKRKDRQTIPWSKEKKRKDRQTMPWSKEKKRKDQGIVCLSFLFF